MCVCVCGGGGGGGGWGADLEAETTFLSSSVKVCNSICSFIRCTLTIDTSTSLSFL